MIDKKIIFSGIKPSGRLNIGGYIGALSQWVEMQDKYNCIFCVVDYHAITVKQNPDELRLRTMELIKTYIAAGINPKNCILFKQSDVPAHTELGWVLNCCMDVGLLKRMTQFNSKTGILSVNEKQEYLQKYFNEVAKNSISQIGEEIKNKIKKDYSIHKIISLAKNNEKELNSLLTGLVADVLLITSQKSGDYFSSSFLEIIKMEEKEQKKFFKANVGLFDYPVLMAADILLYNTEVVPVGEDQRQHVELARDLARRFNKEYSEIFKIPEAVVRKEGARIMSLQDPTKKMSKSDESGLGCIDLLDDIETAKKKIMRAVTDSDSEVKYDVKNKPAVANLLTIYSYLSGQTVKDIEKEYVGKGYGDFKKGLAEVVAKFLKEFQDKYYALSDGQVLDILEEGRKSADKIASETLEKVRRAVGVR